MRKSCLFKRAAFFIALCKKVMPVEEELEKQLREHCRVSPSRMKITGNDDGEIRFLRFEVKTLRFRLSEAECGLSRLDERTLTGAARQVRRRSSADEIDRCRLNSGVPIQLIGAHKWEHLD